MTRQRAVDRLAYCRGCSWTADGPNAQAIAANHHDQTGHQVKLVVTTVYGDVQQPDTQTDLITALAEQDTPRP